MIQKLIPFVFAAVSATASAQQSAPLASATPPSNTLQLPLTSATPENITLETGGPKQTPSSAVENSVVKVFSSMRAPDLYKPWAKQASTEVTGSGVVIEGKRILTNAHVVVFSSEIQVQANQAGDKISAKLEAIAPGIDLAVLRIEEDKFFDTHRPLPRAEKLPDIKTRLWSMVIPLEGQASQSQKALCRESNLLLTISRPQGCVFSLTLQSIRAIAADPLS